MRISLVTPLYNSEPYVAELYRRAKSAIGQITDDYEIVFVNDDSPDASLQTAKRIAASDSRVVVIDLSRNFGQHAALMTGIAASTGDYVFICDSDLEEEPEWIPVFFEELKKHACDVVYGVQTAKRGSVLYRIARRVFYKSLNLVSGIDFPANITTARLMTRRYVDALLQYRERELFAAGIWFMTGFEQRPHNVVKPNTSATTYRFGRLAAIFVNAVTAFSTRPLNMISLAGIIISAVAVLFIAFLFYRKLFLGIATEGWTSVMATTLLLGGVIVLFNGIMAVYLAKIFIEVKQRPLTTIREITNAKMQAERVPVAAQTGASASEPRGGGYHEIVRHYERCLAEHGNGARAVDWKNEDGATKRYDVMLGLLAHETGPVSLLDFGCGLGGLKRHIESRGLSSIRYEGLDISEAFVAGARARHPDTVFHCMDVMADCGELPAYDYIVMNGIFTRRETMPYADMLRYMESLTSKVFRHATRGLAFNVMSPEVDWKGEALFHPSFEDMMRSVSRDLSRNVVLRNDYGLYECTCYVYREPR
ncbi:MAG: glycosyltransferase [Nitrobacter sp.]